MWQETPPPPTVTACICGPVRAHFVSDVTDPSKHRYCLSFKGSITFKMTDGKTTSTLPHVAPSSGVPRPFVRAGLPAGASGGLLGTWHSSSSACVSGKANWELYFETYFAGPGIPCYRARLCAGFEGGPAACIASRERSAAFPQKRPRALISASSLQAGDAVNGLSEFSGRIHPAHTCIHQRGVSSRRPPPHVWHGVFLVKELRASCSAAPCHSHPRGLTGVAGIATHTRSKSTAGTAPHQQIWKFRSETN